MKRTLRLILTGLLLVLSTMLHSLVVKADASLNVSDFAGLQSALSDADSVINITIDASFEITALLTVPTGKTVTITSGTGGPYTLTREGSVTGNLITVAASSSLTLSNIILDGNKGALNANGSLILSNGDLTLNAGAVIQNNASGNAATIGGGITINATGSFTMHGGRITNNSSNSYGGGLYINGFSTPYLIDGGEFSYNHADAPGLGCGGAIESYGIGTITNTLFIGNSVAYMGGAIDNMGNMTIGAGVVIRENTAAYGGGIFNERAGGVVTINGAEILYNTAEYGGGIFNEDALIINSATISYNEATLAGGGGIYTSKPNVANSNWHTDVLGGTISYNIAKTDGGGIYSNKANLTILTVGAGVVFENNSIGNAANVGIEAADQPTYDANIHATTWTVPFSNGYNNVDIAYTSVGTDSHPVQLVTFDTEGGSAVASVTVDPSGVLSKPTAPTKSNLYFAGWYTDDAFTSKYDFDLPVTTNLTLYAKWVSDPSSIQYDVFFDTMGGSAEAPEVMNYGNKAVEPVPPTLANKVFAGWYTDTGYTTKYNFNLPVESDLTLYAKWVDTEEEIEVAVFFEKNLPAGATDNITAMPITQYVPYSTNFSLLSSMVPTGSPASYTFVGWATTPTGSAVFKATMFNAGEGIYDASAGKIIMGLIYGNTSTIYALTSDVHLYAIWKAPSSGGSGSGSSAVSAIPLSGVTHSLSDFYLPMLIGAIMLATIRTANKRKYQ